MVWRKFSLKTFLVFLDKLVYLFFLHLFLLCSVGGGESLYGLPVLCTGVLSIFWGKFIIVFFFFCTPFSKVEGNYSSWFLRHLFSLCPWLTPGAGILHHLPVGDPLRLLCVTVSRRKCTSIHCTARRWETYSFCVSINNKVVQLKKKNTKDFHICLIQPTQLSW